MTWLGGRCAHQRIGKNTSTCGAAIRLCANALGFGQAANMLRGPARTGRPGFRTEAQSPRIPAPRAGHARHNRQSAVVARRLARLFRADRAALRREQVLENGLIRQGTDGRLWAIETPNLCNAGGGARSKNGQSRKCLNTGNWRKARALEGAAISGAPPVFRSRPTAATRSRPAARSC
jgi:hypothetical protein